MKHRNMIVAGLVAASTAYFGIAYAHGPGCDGDGQPGMKRSSMQERGGWVEQRLARLKSDLKLTAEQEPLWQAFAEKSKAEATKGMQAMGERANDEKPQSAPERMARMQGLMKQRLAAMESVNESFNRLYAALTPEQKAAADKHFSRSGRHHHWSRDGAPGRDGPGAPGGERRQG